MRILVFQHSLDCPAGSTEIFFQQRRKGKLSLDFHLWSDGSQPLKNPADYDGLIILGGAPNVDEEDKFPWLKPEKKQIREFLTSQKPILGLCLGGQLLAEALDAEVRRRPHPEVGWHAVEMDPQISSLVEFSPPVLEVFQWHGYEFKIPKVARKFAGNSASEQGFVWQDRVVGLQFHPEATRDWILQCAEDYDFPSGPLVQNRQAIKDQIHKVAKMEDWYFHLLDRMFL